MKERMIIRSRLDLLSADETTGVVKGVLVHLERPIPRRDQKTGDRFDLVLKKGCYKRSLDHDPRRPMLCGPDHDRAVGVGDALISEEGNLVKFEGQFIMTTDIGRHNFEMVRRGIYDGTSVESFRVRQVKQGSRVDALECGLDNFVILPRRNAADMDAGVRECFSEMDMDPPAIDPEQDHLQAPGHWDQPADIKGSDPAVRHSLMETLKNCSVYFRKEK